MAWKPIQIRSIEYVNYRAIPRAHWSVGVTASLILTYNKVIVEYLECFPMLRAYETNRKREKQSFHVKTQGNGI